MCNVKWSSMVVIRLWTGATCKYWNDGLNTCHLFDLQKDTNLTQWDSYTCSDDSQRDLDIISAASREWPFATRMACKVSTREDLTAGSDESLSPRRSEWHPESAAADPWRTAGWALLGTVPEVPGTRKLFPAEERSESSEHLETERPSARLEGPSWMVEGIQ